MPVGKGYMYAYMKQLVARVETSNKSSSRTSNRNCSWGGNRSSYTAPQAEAEVAFWADGEAE